MSRSERLLFAANNLVHQDKTATNMKFIAAAEEEVMNAARDFGEFGDSEEEEEKEEKEKETNSAAAGKDENPLDFLGD